MGALIQEIPFISLNYHQPNEALDVQPPLSQQPRGSFSPLYHVLQVAELGLPRGHDLDGIGGEGAMDKSPGVQETQSVDDLEQNVQNGLGLQHWEFCTLGGKKTPKASNLHGRSLNLR